MQKKVDTPIERPHRRDSVNATIPLLPNCGPKGVDVNKVEEFVLSLSMHRSYIGATSRNIISSKRLYTRCSCLHNYIQTDESLCHQIAISIKAYHCKEEARLHPTVSSPKIPTTVGNRLWCRFLPDQSHVILEALRWHLNSKHLNLKKYDWTRRAKILDNQQKI